MAKLTPDTDWFAAEASPAEIAIHKAVTHERVLGTAIFAALGPINAAIIDLRHQPAAAENVAELRTAQAALYAALRAAGRTF